MKAYKDKEGRVRLFRPDKNMARMNSSMARLSMPALDEQGYLECIKQVGVRIALMVSHCI
jgi:branched-subunit amino acid aminotransferase/4-amino-4-deoxychorismate lyase